MKNNRLEILSVIILDIALILYLIVFLHDLTIENLTCMTKILSQFQWSTG